MRNSLTMSAEEVEALIGDGTQYVVRFMVMPGEEVHVNDMIRGDVMTFQTCKHTTIVMYAGTGEQGQVQ